MSGQRGAAAGEASPGSSQYLPVQTTTDSRAEEWLLMLKLPASGFQALAEFLVREHSYDEPEIVATPIVAGSESYLSWIAEETRAR